MIGFFREYAATERYNKLNSDRRKAIQLSRLNSLLVHAQKNSQFYGKLFKDAGINLVGTSTSKLNSGLVISDIPSTNRKKLTESYEEWLCDNRIKLSDITAFTSDPNNIGTLFHNKYLVFKTSGTTGLPLTTLYDRQALNVFHAVYHSIKFANKEDFQTYKNARIAYVCAKGFLMANGLCYANDPARFLTRNTKMLVDQSQPIQEMVKELNEFKPGVLRSFPTTLELLADERKAGRLRITPSLVTASGEDLSDEVREYLMKSFGCPVHSWYISTEAGVIASECALRRYHLNEDWIIVEPIDSNGNHVPDGQFSDKILLTNLSNFTQPFIRYEVSDRVALHSNEPCQCGNPAPWIEIQGRSDAVAHFDTPNGKVKVTPWLFHSMLIGKTEIRRYQFVIQSGNVIEVRLEANDRCAAFALVCESLTQKLKAMGADVSIKLSDDLPKIDVSGKFQCVIMR
jgi:phenylacetate-coenzyme A ligase PaaK-like adenylate-forming protein